MDVDKWIEDLGKCEKLRESEVRSLCELAKPVLIHDGNLIRISSPITVVGDVHGQLWDVIEMFEVSGEVPALTYLFLGDYVDRGFNSIETFLYLIALKVRYPTRLYLLRGNHESKEITQVYGFYDECIRKYGSIGVWKQCVELFKFLTLAALIDEKIFCVHGGLSPSLERLDQLKSINRIQELPLKGPITDLLWSDPEDVKGWGVNPRGAGYLYGPDVTMKFAMDNGIDLIARSHQLVLEGYKWHFKQKVVTIWSAPNYCYRCGNLASVMQFHENKSKSFIVFDASPEQNRNSFWIPRFVPEYFL